MCFSFIYELLERAHLTYSSKTAVYEALDQITGPLIHADLKAAAKMFRVGVWEITWPIGEVDLLISIQSAAIFPTTRGCSGKSSSGHGCSEEGCSVDSSALKQVNPELKVIISVGKCSSFAQISKDFPINLIL